MANALTEAKSAFRSIIQKGQQVGSNIRGYLKRPPQAQSYYDQVQQTSQRYRQQIGSYLNSPQFQSAVQQGVKTAQAPLNLPGSLYVAQQLQRIPEVRPANPLFFGLTVPGQLVSSQLRSYGKSFERLATPGGRRGLLSSSKQLLSERPGLGTLANPAVQTAFDISDFLPGGLLFAGGVKAVTKKGLKEAGERVAMKEIGRVVSKPRNLELPKSKLL